MHPHPPKKAKFEVRFAPVTYEDARGTQSGPLNPRRRAAQVEFKKLFSDDKQCTAVCQLYKSNNVDVFEEEYEPDKGSQLEAATILASQNLDPESLESPASRWSIKDSMITGKGKKTTKKILYQW